MEENKRNNVENGLSGNVDLGFSTNKKRFSVNGDTSKVIEFDPSDLGVADRMSKTMPKFKELNSTWEKIHATAEEMSTVEDEDAAFSAIDKFSKQFDELEKNVRELIDYIFDGKVADLLLGNSSSFSPVNGKFKYEHIIEAMLKCYEKHIQEEAPKFDARKIQKYTKKYVGK